MKSVPPPHVVDVLDEWGASERHGERTDSLSGAAGMSVIITRDSTVPKWAWYGNGYRLTRSTVPYYGTVHHPKCG